MVGRRQWIIDGKQRSSVDEENTSLARDNINAGPYAARRCPTTRYRVPLHYQAIDLTSTAGKGPLLVSQVMLKFFSGYSDLVMTVSFSE